MIVYGPLLRRTRDRCAWLRSGLKASIVLADQLRMRRDSLGAEFKLTV